MFEHVRSIRLQADRATGVAEIPADLPSLADHFPGRTVLPGSWLVELAAQIAGPLAEEVTWARHDVQRWAVLALIRDVKLPSAVDLPAKVRIEATLVKAELAAVTVKVEVRCDASVVMRGELMLAMIETPMGAEAAVRERHARLARWKAGP